MMFIPRAIKHIFILLLMTMIMLPSLRADAQRTAPTVIRDTEIENILKEWMLPLLEAADLGPDAVNYILLQSNTLNAFVAGGANMFLYSGLIQTTKTPGELMGVMAHELGHITGGHLIASHSQLERASYQTIIGTLLGAATAVATGNPGAALAVSSLASHTAIRGFLSHSRINESSADQAAMNSLEDAKLNPSGLISFFEQLSSEELIPASQQSEYVRTHPITRNRIDALQVRLEESPYKDTPYPPRMVEQHARMKAKLIGYISPGRVPWVYHDRDNSIAANYARTIAYYRNEQTDKAVEAVNGLLLREPNNPYFLELKGQMLVESGRVKDAIAPYRKAVEIMPGAALIRIALAHALIESDGKATHDKNTLNDVIKLLERALRDEPRSSRAHRLMATAQGRLGNDALAKLHLAEEATLQRNFAYARKQAETALKSLEENSQDWIQAKDLLTHLDTVKKDG